MCGQAGICVMIASNAALRALRLLSGERFERRRDSAPRGV
jgi:hypothetical protein